MKASIPFFAAALLAAPFTFAEEAPEVTPETPAVEEPAPSDSVKIVMEEEAPEAAPEPAPEAEPQNAIHSVRMEDEPAVPEEPAPEPAPENHARLS